MEKIRGKGNVIFQTVSIVVLAILSLAAILPFVLLVSSSFTDENTLLASGYSFWPKVFSLEAYTFMFGTNLSNILRAYGITILVTAVGTSVSLLIGPLIGYVLSRKDYYHRKFMSFYVFFTMLFNGGIVPAYMMWTQIFHLKNTLPALLLPNLLLNGFWIIIMRSNFESNIHPSLIEAAKIDGAGEVKIYFKIVLPLSLPILATIGLMAGLGYWNDWTNGLYYISDSKLYSLQQLLNNILTNVKALSSMGTAAAGTQNLPSESIQMAMAVIGVIPILIVYPFFQKYFVKGIAMGGVKE